MKKKKLSHDATPEVHSFSALPGEADDILHMYGTYNIQPTADTDNVFPLIAPGLPRRYRDMELSKEEVERMGEQNDRP